MTTSEFGQTSSDAARSQIRALFDGAWTVGAVVRFHSVHKLLLMAHSPDAYRELGRLVANARGISRDQFAARYTSLFTAALRWPATRRGHVNVLQHAAGYLKHQLDRATKAELSTAIEDYRRDRVPLAVPMALLRRHVHEYGVAYLANQIYVDPRSG
jgi:uncharacterized protein YbgA (DUF1722 family)